MSAGYIPAGAVHRVGILAVAALLLLALRDPPLPWGLPAGELTLLLDDSKSLATGAVDEAWATLSPLLHRLPKGSRVNLIRFGSEPALELFREPTTDALPATLPRRIAVSQLGTDIAAALDLIPADSTAVLVSDGRATSGAVEDALDALLTRGVALSWWQLADPQPQAWIESMEAPPEISTHTRVPLAVGVVAAGSTESLLTVAIDDRPALHRRLDLRREQRLQLALDLPALDVGTHEITVMLSTPQTQRVGDGSGRSPATRASSLVRVHGNAPVLLIGESSERLAAALGAGGWATRSLGLDAIANDTAPTDAAAELARASVIVLDNVPVASFGPRFWQRLAEAVTMRGSGLLVLGGDRSLRAGGYRHSTLERLLPVLSEPPPRLPAATVLFAIDTSGSMAQPASTGLSRFSLARLAAADAAAVLGAQDRVGLALFGTDAALALPIQVRPATDHTIMETAAAAPTGGTRLAPLVELALAELGVAGGAGGSEPEKRLLALFSDGQFADGHDLDPSQLGRRLAAASVEVLAVGVGEPGRAGALRQLAGAANGRFHQAAGAALPRFVAELLQDYRTDPRRGPFEAIQANTLPFPTHPAISAWPAVAAYQPVRLRDGAAAPLLTRDGDPLLAWQPTGLGRVAVLTAGLGSFAPSWQSWTQLPALLGPMLAWLGGEDRQALLSMTAEHTADQIRLTVDAMDADGDWPDPAPLRWRLEQPEPAGASVHSNGRVEPVAPGRFELDLPAPDTGRYDVALSLAGRELRRAIRYDPRLEWLPRQVGRDSLAALAGLPRWTPSSRWPPPGWPEARRGAGPFLAGAALLLFIGLVIRERLPRDALDKTMQRTRPIFDLFKPRGRHNR